MDGIHHQALIRWELGDLAKAKELGLNSRSLIKNIPNPKQRWKLHARNWIEEMYAKRFRNQSKG